jgi:hypothetical protein
VKKCMLTCKPAKFDGHAARISRIRG